LSTDTPAAPRRCGSVIGLRGEHEAQYRELHAAVWPAVLEQIKRSNISNYTIFFHAGLLLSYFEYQGEDFEADMAAMAADPLTGRWWDVVKPMQEQIPGTADADWWMPITEVFHLD
jgi:L-rhamnose mutarotase